MVVEIAIEISEMAWQHSSVLDCRLSYLHLPSGRCGHSMCVWRSSLVLFAGFDGTKWLNDVHILNTESLVWTQPRLAGITPEVRQYHSAALLENRMFVFGGYNGVSWLSDLLSLDLQTGIWKRPKASGDLPTPKEGHAMAAYQSWLYVFGGWDGAAVAELHRFHTDLYTWEKLVVAGTGPAVCGHSMSLVKDQLFVFGGYTGETWSRNMYRLELNQETLVWELLETQGNPKARGYHSSVVVSRFILIYAGYNGSHILGDLLAFDTEARAWSFPDPFTEHSLDARNAHTMTRIGSELYLFGGYNGFRDTNDLHILESAAFSTLHDDISKAAASEQWKDVSLVAGGEVRWVHAALLATRCPVLSRQMVRDEHHARVFLPIIAAATLEALCEFLYSDGVKTSWWSLVKEELRDLASLYQLPRLKQLCEDFSEAPDSTFSSDIMKIRSLQEYSDLTIIVENQQFHTHKFILSCRCPYFELLLHTPMREHSASTLHLPGLSAAAFSLVLDWIYSDKFTPLFSDSGIDIQLGFLLLRDAGALMLDCLVRMTEIALQKQVTIGNVCRMLDFSFDSSAAKLRAGCLNYLLKNFERVDRRDLAGLSAEARQLLKSHLPRSLQKQADLTPPKATLVKLDSLPTSLSPYPLNIKGEKLTTKAAAMQETARATVSFREKGFSIADSKLRKTIFCQGIARKPEVFIKAGQRVVAGFHRSLSGLM